MKAEKIFPMFLLVFVFTLVAVAFLLPFREQRKVANDRLISQVLDDYSSEIKNFAREKDRLPANLSEIELDSNIVKNNPGVIDKIEYKPNDKLNFTKNFQFCSTFNSEQKGRKSLYGSSSYSSVDYGVHPSGYHCFDEESVSSSSYYRSWEDQQRGVDIEDALLQLNSQTN